MAKSVQGTTQKRTPFDVLISTKQAAQTTPEQRLSRAYDAAVETPVLDKATAESDMNFFQKSLGLFENAGAAAVGGLRNIINDAGYRSQAAAPLLAGDDAYYKAMSGNKDTGVQIPEDTRTPEQRELDEYMGLGPSYTPEARAMAKAIEDSYKKLDETGLTRTTSIGDKYAQEVAEKYAGAGDKWQRAYGISQSAGQQVLPMAARHIPVVGPLLSSLMFFGQASGGATEEALADGADWDKALTYGAAIGGVEAGTEALGELGKQAVISKFGKSASTGSFGKALSGVLSNNNATRTMLGVLGNATSEGGEEVLSDLISPFAKSIYNDKSLGENWKDEVTVQKLWDDFLGGFAVGGLMDGARAITGGYRGQNQNYQNETVNQAIQDARTAAKEHGIFSDESIAATMGVAQAIETLEGNQATAAQDANRYRQIANEMKRAQNGDIGAQDRLAALLAAEAGISPTSEQQRSTDPSAQTGQTTNEAPTTFAVEDMLKNPVNRSQANRIINDANLRAEYEAYTGEKLPSVKSEAAKAVMEYSRNHAELTPMAQVVLNQRSETSPVPETQTDTVSLAAQTMARAAAQNSVQESVPARTEIPPATQPEVSPAATEVSSAARTMADVLTGKPAESTLGDNIPQQPQNANGTPTSPDAPTRLSQTVETVRDAAVTPDAVKQSINENIENGGYRYIPESNADAVASARTSIKENGYDSVLRSWTESVARGKTSNDLFATGAVLYNEAIRSGNTKLALDILSDYQLLGTNTAQGLQAASIIKNLTPDGQLYIMQRDVKKLNDSRSETAKRKNPEGYKIDPELADAFINAKDEAARDAAVTAIQQDIASQIPASFAEKWRALRYLNMLGNVKTQVRNILGNTAMMGLTGAKNTMLTGIEYLANKLSGGKYERNTAFGVRDYMDAAKKYYKIVDDYVNGDAKFMESNMNDSFSSGIQDARKIFGFKPLEAYRKATQWAMTQGDVLFIRPQFARSLSGYLKARGMDANTFTQIVNGDIQATAEQQNLIHNATEYAAREAQEATFHDNNEISKAVSKVGKGWPAPVRAIFEGILPFRKTPANVLVRAEEYSPLGVVNTAVNAYQAAKGLNGKTAADVINSFSKTATGTSLFALGAMLAKAGLARGKEDDEEQAAFDKLQGKQDFSVVLPDGSSYTIDWLSPAAVPFFMGVAFSDAMSDGDITVGEFLKALDTLTDPMIEMSMLQGVNDALDQIKYSDNALVNFALNQMVNYVSQGIGNTLYGQIERITEKNRETTYTASDTPEGRTWERTFGKIMNKLPGEYNQVEYVDAWGRTQSNGSVAERAFSNLLSPGYIGKNRSTEVDNELQRLYDAGQTNVFPSRIAMTQTVNVYRNDGRKIDARRLTKDEYVQYQKVMGQTSLELVKDLMKSPVYHGMSDEAKADAISEIYGYAKRMAAMAVEPSAKYGEKTDVSKLSNPAAYYAAKASFSAASKDSENRNYAELDSLTASFNRLPSDVRDAVTNGNSGLAKLLDARENGYTARQYYNVYDTVNALTPAEGYADVATWQKIDAVCSMNVSDKEKDYFVMNYFEGSTKDKYTAAREAGYSPYSVSVAYQTYQLSKGVDRNGDGRNDTGTKKAAFISAMMEQGASRKSAEWLYNLFK